MCRPKRRRYIERDGARPFGGLRFIKSFLPQQSDPFFRGALDRTPPNQRRTCGRLIIIVRGIRLFGNVRTAVWKAEPKTVEENRATYTSATRSVHSRQMSRIVAGSAGGNRCRSWNVFEGGVGGSGARARQRNNERRPRRSRNAGGGVSRRRPSLSTRTGFSVYSSFALHAPFPHPLPSVPLPHHRTRVGDNFPPVDRVSFPVPGTRRPLPHGTTTEM